MEISYTVVRILQRFSGLELVSPLQAKSAASSMSLQKSDISPGDGLLETGKESYAWRRSHESDVGYKTEVLMMPAKEIQMVFRP